MPDELAFINTLFILSIDTEDTSLHNKALDDVGYSLLDLDNDFSPELIIGMTKPFIDYAISYIDALGQRVVQAISENGIDGSIELLQISH